MEITTNKNIFPLCQQKTFDTNGDIILITYSQSGQEKKEKNLFTGEVTVTKNFKDDLGQEIERYAKLSPFGDIEMRESESWLWSARKRRKIFRKNDQIVKQELYNNKGYKTDIIHDNGVEEKFAYDEQGRIIYSKRTEGMNSIEQWRTYSKKGRSMKSKRSDGVEFTVSYDKDGNQTKISSSHGYEAWTKYDKNGNKTQFFDTKGNKEYSNYDKMGNRIYYANANHKEEWWKYDGRGNVTHYVNSLEYEQWTTNLYYDEIGVKDFLF